MENTVLELKNVSKSFGKRKIIDNISLKVNSGEIFGFLGPNGSGKTTTIKMILRLIDSDEGEIKVNGFDNRKQFEQAMECIGAIVENPDMYKYMSGIDNLKLHARIRNIDERRIYEVLEMVGLKDRAKDKVGKYSLGMKQRLGLALTLLHNPKVLILDEPTNGLDPAGIKQLRDILKKISHEENVAVFVSSHILTEMQQMCDRVAVLDNGKIVKIEQITNSEEEKIETIELRIKDKTKAIKILKEKFEVDAKEEKDSLLVTIQTEKVPEVVRELAIEDVGIKAVIPREHNLEEIFFDATEGGKNE
jgi:ABC-2 type transport system ATP-binding protein